MENTKRGVWFYVLQEYWGMERSLDIYKSLLYKKKKMKLAHLYRKNIGRKKEKKKGGNSQQVRNTLTRLTELTRSSSNKPISKEPKPLSGDWLSKVLLAGNSSQPRNQLASIDWRNWPVTPINNNGSMVDRLIREVGRVPVAYRWIVN